MNNLTNEEKHCICNAEVNIYHKQTILELTERRLRILEKQRTSAENSFRCARGEIFQCHVKNTYEYLKNIEQKVYEAKIDCYKAANELDSAILHKNNMEKEIRDRNNK